MYRRMGRILASLLSVSMIWGNLAFAVTSGTPADGNIQGQTEVTSQPSAAITDTANHWAKDAIERWSKRGIVKGISADKFEPDRSVTRSEWVSLLNRVFQLQTGKETGFKDVSADKWYASDVSTAVYGGYIQGFSDGTFRPTASLSRAEAAVSISRLLKLPTGPNKGSFADQQSIKEWSKDAIRSVVEEGIITGYNNNTFQPAKALTRAEAVSLIDRAVNYYGKWYGESGVYGPTEGMDKIKGSVVINTTGITLQNTEVSGDLIIGKGVGTGDVYLKNINVKGQVYVYGGGEHSIHLQDSIVLKIIVDKKDGSVRLVAEGNSSIQEVTIKTGATLDVSKGVSVDRVSLSESLPADSTVILKGHFNTVNVEAYSISLKIPEGSIKELNLTEHAANSTIETSKESSILSLILDAAVKVLGLGNIQNSVVNAQGVSFEKKPEKLSLGSNAPADTKVSIGGAPAAPVSPQVTPTTPPIVASGGGDSGSSSSTATPVPTATPAPTSTPTPTATPEQTAPPLVSESIKVENQYVSVGEAVYFTSAYDLDVYLASSRIYSNKDTLDLAVESGEAQLLHVKAGEKNYFDTSLFRNVSFPQNFEFSLLGFNGNSLTTYVRITILNEQEALNKYAVVYTYLSDPEYLSLNYNRLLQWTEGQSPESAILIRETGGEYKPFTSAIGTVELEGNTIYIKPLAGVVEHGKSYDFKLLEGAVTTSSGERNAAYEIFKHIAPNKLSMISPTVEEGQYGINIKTGDILTFSVTDPGVVYLVPRGTSGTQAHFDELVHSHWGAKLVIDATMVNKPLELDTSELSPGEYILQAWYGTSINVTIEE